MGELNRAERIQIMLTPKELKLVDNWRFENACQAAHQPCENCSSADCWPRVLTRRKWRSLKRFRLKQRRRVAINDLRKCPLGTAAPMGHFGSPRKLSQGPF